MAENNTLGLSFDGDIALQVKDQQEAERKKVTSQEIQQALQEQTKVISQKQLSVKHDLSQVEPAVIEAQNGKPTLNLAEPRYVLF